MVINVTNRKNRIILIVIFLCLTGLVSVVSIYSYIGGFKYNRFQYCLKLYGKKLDFNYLPAYDKAYKITEEADGEIRYSFIGGDWYVVNEEADRVIYFNAFSHQVRQYDHGQLTSILVERVQFNGMPIYDEYEIT
mgnify:FL=1